VGYLDGCGTGYQSAFLYQQNSLRDALIAGSTLNIFNNHADRVKMLRWRRP